MLPLTEAALATFILVMSRITGIFLVEPFFGSKTIPAQVKAALIMVLSLSLFPLVSIATDAAQINMVFILRIAYEVLIGVVIGFLFLAIFLAVQAAGSFIDLEMGFGLSQAMDPTGNVESTALSRLYYMLALVIFLMANGEQLLVKATVVSFTVFPAGSMVFPKTLAPGVLNVLSDVMLMAVKVAGPVVGALFIADVVFGVIARAVPQMNVFVIGFPVKIILGLVAVMVTMPLTVRVLQDLFVQLERILSQALA